MRSKTIIKHGVRIVVHDDGSITRPDCIYKAKRTERFYGSENSHGYRSVGIEGRKILMHRLVAEAFLPDFDDSLDIDHRNGVKDDNRIVNLRHMQDDYESRRAFIGKAKGCSSRFRGVIWDSEKNLWRARIGLSHKLRQVGYFETEEAAAIAYDRRAKELGFDEQALNRTHFTELSMLSGAY